MMDKRDEDLDAIRSSEPSKIEVSDIRAQLDRILNHEGFSDSPRLKAFLEFVVKESSFGHADRIKATTIAQEVFGRGGDFDPQSDSIVRVEAGRLRNRLSEYYHTNGSSDPILIEIPKGGYLATFQWTSPLGETSTPINGNQMKAKKNRYVGLGFIAVNALVLLALGGWVIWLLASGDGSEETDKQQFTKNTEAYAMFQQARQIGRPPSNKTRVLAAMDLSREIVKLDPNFGGGYASESFILWTYIVFGHSKSPEEDANRVRELAERAIQVDPEFSGGYQSLSRALHLVGDIGGAVSAAKKAIDLEPKNAELYGNLGLILISLGRPTEAIEPLLTAIRLSDQNVRNPYRNYLGMAYFHTGKYNESIEKLESNRNLGGPMGPHMFAYLSAAYAKIGNVGRAHAAAEFVRQAQAKFSVRGFIGNLLRDAKSRQQLFSAISLSGIDLT